MHKNKKNGEEGEYFGKGRGRGREGRRGKGEEKVDLRKAVTQGGRRRKETMKEGGRGEIRAGRGGKASEGEKIIEKEEKK